MLTQVVVHSIEGATFLKNAVSLAGHGDLIALVSGKQSLLSSMLRKGSIWRHVQGDDLGHNLTGRFMARRVRMGHTVMAATATPQQIHFSNHFDTFYVKFKEVQQKRKDGNHAIRMTMQGKEVVAVHADKRIELEGGTFIDASGLDQKINQFEPQLPGIDRKSVV